MAETKKTFELREIDNFFVKFGRFALFIVIIYTDFEWKSVNEFTLSSWVCFELARDRQLGIEASDLRRVRILLLLERIRTATIILSYRSMNFWLRVTSELFFTSAICSGFMLWSSNWQKLQRKDGIHSANRRETKEKSEMFIRVTKIVTELGRLIFWLERVAIIALFYKPGYAPVCAVIFCACQLFHIICFFIPSDVNPIKPGHDCLFFGEQVAVRRAEVGMTNLAILIFACTSICYMIDHLIENNQLVLRVQRMRKRWQEAKLRFTWTKFNWNPFVMCQQTGQIFSGKIKGEKSDTEKMKIEDHPPKEESNKRETNNGEEPEKETVKVEDDSLKAEDSVEADVRLNKTSEVEEDAPEEENMKWEEDVAEIREHSYEESEVDHYKAAREQRDTWEDWFLPELSRFCNLEDMNMAYNSSYLGEGWRESEEVSDLSGNCGSEIENNPKATTADSAGTISVDVLKDVDEVERLNAGEGIDEVQKLKADEGIDEVEKLKAENDILKRENTVLEERLVSERLILEASQREWKFESQKFDALILELNKEIGALAGALEIHRKLEKDMATRLGAYQEDCRKWDQEKREIAAKLQALSDYTKNLQNKCEDEKAAFVQQMKTEFSMSLTDCRVALKEGEKALRESQEKRRMLMEMNKMLVRKLQVNNNSGRSSNADRVYELEEKCRMLEEDKRNLAEMLLAATVSSEGYRDLLHNLGC